MTMPDERTRSIVQTREFLESLSAGAEGPGIPDSVKREAHRLLRHFPDDWHIAHVAAKVPQFWADPDELKRPR